MPKKHSVLGDLWDAWVWLATGFLHILYLIARAIYRAAQSLMGKAFAETKKRAAISRRPQNGPSYESLLLQKKVAGNLDDFESKVLSSKSTIGLILGSRGSGKSALGMRILENVAAKTDRVVCAMGFDPRTLPAWIRSVNAVEEVPNGSFVLVDEGGITFSSRDSMSSANKVLSSLLLVARHKDLSVLFISQNSANLEINAIRQSDYLLMRKPSLLQKEFERKKIGKIYDEIAEQFANLLEKGRYSTYVYADEFQGFVLNELPGFWSMRASKSFASLDLKQGKK